MVVESLDKAGSDVLFVVQIGEGELCNDGRAAECIRRPEGRENRCR